MNDPNETASASLGEKPTLVEAAHVPIDIGLSEDVHPPSIDPTGLSNGRLIIFALSQLVLWAAHAAIILEVSFSLPVIQEDFEISEADVQWVIASYMLTWGCSQPIAGRLCDVFGRKRGFYLGVGSFVVLNIVATFMPNLASLNVVRALTGIASAISLPASSGIVGALYPPGRKRTLAYVAITCGGAAGASAGELLAGIFIQWIKWTWRPCFFTVGLICIVPLLATYLIVPDDPAVARGWSVDWLGAGAIGSGLLCFLLALTLAQTSAQGWSASYLPALFVVAALLLALFVWRQRQLTRAVNVPGNTKPPPLIPHGLLSWKNRDILVICVASFFNWAATESISVFISYLYFDVLGMSAFEAGLKFSVTFFSGTTAAVIVAVTISSVPPRILMAICCLISSTSSILFAARELSWPYWRGDLWAFLLIAYGTDGTIAAGSAIISQTALPEDQSVTASLFQTSCRLGFAVGLAISSLVRDSVQNAASRRGDTEHDAVVEGLRGAFWTLTGFMLLAACIVGFGMKGWQYLDEGKVEVDGAQEGSDVPEGIPEGDHRGHR